MRLDQLPMRSRGHIAAVDWAGLPANEARRLRELGFDEGIAVEMLHQGPIGRDPLAVRVGRMVIAVRRAQAAFVEIEPLAAAHPSRYATTAIAAE